MTCVTIGRDRKSIVASLKDLDSAIGKLDNVLMGVVFIISLLILASMLTANFKSVLTSAGSTLLALSWYAFFIIYFSLTRRLFSATAQEILASLIFVFIKHPFDVGDRVDITINSVTTSLMVKEISLLSSEFTQLTGQVIQAPNSLLNTLFILNMRRSSAIAEPVKITLKFGTTLEQIDSLRLKMTEFVQSEKRDYQSKILTELTDIPDLEEVHLNVVFFHKSNWQNELLRLSRRNRFMCALMQNITALGIDSPNKALPGGAPHIPMYVHGLAAPSSAPSPSGGTYSAPPTTEAYTPAPQTGSPAHRDSVVTSPSETKSQAPVDLSLGARDMAMTSTMEDIFEESNQQPYHSRVEAIREGASSLARRSSSLRHRSNVGRSNTASSHLSRQSGGGGGGGGGGGIRLLPSIRRPPPLAEFGPRADDHLRVPGPQQAQYRQQFPTAHLRQQSLEMNELAAPAYAPRESELHVPYTISQEYIGNRV